jgi:mycothiol system anti-sigma-R factor
MRCEEVLIRLWEYLDEELTAEEAERVKGHLRSCPRCHPAYCCDRAFLELLARQRGRCTAPFSLLAWVRSRSF